MQFHRTLIWHLARPSPSHPTTRTSPRTRQCWSQASYNAPVKPGTKACPAYNQGKCDNKTTHANLKHLVLLSGVVKRTFPHSEDQCNGEKGASKQVAGRNQHCAVASHDDNQEQPLGMCLDISPHMDNLNSGWNNSIPDNSVPTGISLDSQKSAMDNTAEVSYFPSDRSMPPRHVFSPPSPRHSPNVRFLSNTPFQQISSI